jgi:MFS family permease
MSRNEAALQLEMAGGRITRLALRDNEVFVDGVSVGTAARGSQLDRAWRDLLNRAMDVPTDRLPQLLAEWEPPAGDAGARLSQAIAGIMSPMDAPVAADAPAAPGAPDAVPLSDSVVRLVEKIQLQERELVELREDLETRAEARADRSFRRSPFRHISQGMAGVFSTAITYAVLFGIGFLVIMFGGRRYIEGVADTARHAPGRSLLVGMAAAFLVVPAFVLGIIALVISIVGIPAVLLWLPGFPLAVMGAAVLGYLAVAHAAGESLAERRFYVTDWFQRGNSYYFLLSGLGVLLTFFLASQVVHMAGPWLGVIEGLLIFFGVVANIAAVAIGFGAVLISRAGTRPVNGKPTVEEPDLFTEEASV